MPLPPPPVIIIPVQYLESLINESKSDVISTGPKVLHIMPSNGFNLQQDYGERFLYDQGNLQGEMHPSDWPDRHDECEEEKSMFELSGGASEDGSDDVYVGGDGCRAAGPYQQTNVYHLPEDFRPYANGHQQEFSNQHGTRANAAETKTEHLKVPEPCNGCLARFPWQWLLAFPKEMAAKRWHL